MKNFMNAICMPLVLFGAINWGLIGLLNIDLIAEIARLINIREIAKVIQILIGVSALGAIFGWFGKR